MRPEPARDFYRVAENLYRQAPWRAVGEVVTIEFRCKRATSPLRTGDEVKVVGMAPEFECEREMFVETPWEHKRTLAVPLSQLEVVHGDDKTRQAVEDWHYWVEMGYRF
jgi:hypothetical protein